MAQFDPFIEEDPYRQLGPGLYQNPRAPRAGIGATGDWGGPHLGLGPSMMPPENPLLTQALRSTPNAAVTSNAPTAPPRPRVAPPAAPQPGGGGPGPVDPNYQAPFAPTPSPLGTLPTLLGGGGAAAAGPTPDQLNNQDMNRAILDWQMGLGGTGALEKEASEYSRQGRGIGAGARVPGRHAVDQLTRALGGFGEAYGERLASDKRKDLAGKMQELQSRAMRRMDDVDERQGRGWKRDIEKDSLKQDSRFTDLEDPRFG